jgi:hypothetical protein
VAEGWRGQLLGAWLGEFLLGNAEMRSIWQDGGLRSENSTESSEQ